MKVTIQSEVLDRPIDAKEYKVLLAAAKYINSLTGITVDLKGFKPIVKK